MGALTAVAGPRSEACDPFTPFLEVCEAAREFAASEEARGMKHSDMEREIEARGREMMRTLYQAWLDQQAPGDAEETVRDVEGRERGRKRLQTRELETVFGTTTVARTGYGAEGKVSLHPLDAQLNLPEERYSLEVRRRVAEEASKNAFEEAAETLARYTGAHVTKRQLEELVQRAAVDFDAFYERRRWEGSRAPPPEDDALMVITTDGKGVVMHKEDLRGATRKAKYLWTEIR